MAPLVWVVLFLATGTSALAQPVARGSAHVPVRPGDRVTVWLFDRPSSGTPWTYLATIDANGQATLDQMRAIKHGDATNPDDIATLSSTLIRLVATVTDGDGDQASAIAFVGNTLAFRDDGPSIDATNVDTNSILLTTQDADTRGAAFDTATADLSSAFSAASVQFGADGPAGAGQVTWSYALALGTAAASR